MGHATPFAQVLSDKLGVPFERIRMIQHDSDEMSPGARGGVRRVSLGDRVERRHSGGGRSGHRTGPEDRGPSAGSGGGGHRIRGRGLPRGGDRPVEGHHEPRGSEARGNPALPEDLSDGLDAKCSHDTSPISFPNGCHVCEVEVDPDTGETAVDRYTVVDDFGTVLNPPIVEGQVHGGIAQGLGQVLLENTVYDDDGQLVTGSYMDYAMPRADHMAWRSTSPPTRCRARRTRSA